VRGSVFGASSAATAFAAQSKTSGAASRIQLPF
jgi:hypothetical protein